MAPIKFSFFRTRSKEQEPEQLHQSTVESSEHAHAETQLHADSSKQVNAPNTSSHPVRTSVRSTSKFLLRIKSIDIPYADEDDDKVSSRRRRKSLEEMESLYTKTNITENGSSSLKRQQPRSLSLPSLNLLENDLKLPYSLDLNIQKVFASEYSDKIRIDVTPAHHHINLESPDDANFHVNRNTEKQDGRRASTSRNANVTDDNISSIYSDNGSVQVSCGFNKRHRSRKRLTDCDMWKASDYLVMKNLLARRGSIGDRFKWEAIAAARGLCTLKTNCTCPDCKILKRQNPYPYCTDEDGDAGLGSASLFLNSCSVV